MLSVTPEVFVILRILLRRTTKRLLLQKAFEENTPIIPKKEIFRTVLDMVFEDESPTHLNEWVKCYKVVLQQCKEDETGRFE